MFKSFFSKNKIIIKGINHGAHADYWGAFLGFENFNKDQKILIERINKYLQEKKAKPIDKKYSIIQKNLGDVIDTVIIVDKQDVASFYPIMKSEKVMPFEGNQIHEWNHFDNIEAQILGAGRKTFALNFFATDYLENKKIYQQKKQLNINLSGFAFVIQASTKLPDNFSEDFVSYMPNQQTDDGSVYDFIGKIIDFRKYSYEDIHGFIISTKLINDPQIEDFFVLDIFVNKQNLKIDELKKGMRISGCFWLQGKIAGN